MIELNDLAFQNADILIALADPPAAGWTKKSLADHIGRDDSNVNKTLKALAKGGVLQADPLAGLTEEGAAQLAAIQRARHGGDKRKPRGRCPADRIARNPANRTPAPAAVAALADTIEAAGDVLQAVILTPPDANGVRMLLAGEHRWLAVLLLAAEGRLPLALTDGLPFQEREVSASEQILIRIVENSARADLSPLEDARQLLALQQATGWSAREIAKKTGRSPADSDTGVRDVQVKIKVAREASLDAISAYERDGGWDALRDSVTRPKPAPEPASEPPAQAEASGPDRGDGTWALAEPWIAHATLRMSQKHDRIELRPFSHPDGRWFVSASSSIGMSGHGEPYRISDATPAHPDRETAFAAARARIASRHPHMPLAFRAWLDEVAGSTDEAAAVQAEAAPIQHPSPTRTADGRLPLLTLFEYRHEGMTGWGWLWQGDVADAQDAADAPREFLPNAALARGRAIDTLRAMHRERMPVDLIRWLDGLLGPHFVDGQNCFNATNAGERLRALGWEKRASNGGGGALKAALQTLAEEAKAPPPPADEAPGAPAGIVVVRPNPDVVDRMARHAETAEAGAQLVLKAAIEELVEAIDSHLTGLRAEIIKREVAQDLADFEDDTAFLRESIDCALRAVEALGLGEGEGQPPAEARESPREPGEPFVPIRKSITPDHIVCLYDGRRFVGGLRRHLLTRYNETPEEYRTRWGLPRDYPMVAPNYAKRQYDLLRSVAP